MKLLLKRILPIILAVLLLIYALKDVSFQAIIVQFRRASYEWIIVYGAIAFFIYFLRGKRWQQPLLALGHRPTAFRTTVAFQAGMMASMIVVGSGELTRCATLQRTDNVPFSHSIGSIVAERVLDMIMLLVVLALTFLLEMSRMSAYLSGLTFSASGIIASLVLIGLLGFAGFYILWRQPVIQKHPLTIKIVQFVRGLWEGFGAIRRLPNPALFIMLTIAIQVLSWFATYCLMLSIDSTKHLPATAALTVMAVASLGGLAVPTQGGVGTYHFLVSRALILYGLTTAEGAVVATFMHAVGFAINLVLSSISFLIIPVLIQQRNKEVALESENEPRA